VLKPDGGLVVTVMDFLAKLSARSAPIRLATSGILDALANDDGVSGQGRGAELAVRNP
jgi:hypothetical protein